MLYESKILRIFIRSYQLYLKFWDNSAVILFFAGLVSRISLLCSESVIINFITRKGYLESYFRNSLIFKFFHYLFSAPILASKTLYKKIQDPLGESFIFNFIKVLTIHFNTILSVVVFLIFITPHSYWNNLYATILALFLLTIFVFKAAINKNIVFNIKSISLYLFLFIFIVFMSFAFSLFPKASLRVLIFYITSFTFLLLIISSMTTFKQLHTFLEVILCSVTLISIYGVWQMVMGVPIDPSQIDVTLNEGVKGRIFSTMENPNNFGEILIMILPFYIAVIQNSKTVTKKAFYSICMLFPLVSLIFTSSRSSWIAFVAALGVFLFYKNRKVVPLLLILCLFSIPFLPLSIYKRILSIVNASQDTSVSYRFLIYQSMMPVLKDYWITGIGLGAEAVKGVCGRYYMFTGMIPPHSHNLYFQTCLETGFLGVLSLAGFILGIFKNAIKGIIHNTHAHVKNLLIAIIMSLISILIVGSVEYVWFYPRVFLVFWIVIGIAIATIVISKKQMEDSHD